MPKIVDHDLYRKELLNSCFHLFAEKGYAALTMRQIAQGLGVSTGTLYHYFPSKEALFEQLVRQMTFQDIQSVRAGLKEKKTPLDRIEAVFQVIAQHEDYFIKQTLIWIEFYQNQRRVTGNHTPVFQEIWKENEQEISEMLGIQDENLINFLGCVIDGMLLHRTFNPDKFSLQVQIQLLKKLLAPYLEQSMTAL